MRRFATSLGAASLLLAAVLAPSARADTVGPITFESPKYVAGAIDGQQGWSKTGPFDVAVSLVSGFPGTPCVFGKQALRLSDAVTSGTFGDQTFSPGLSKPAGESATQHKFEMGFVITTAQTALQSGLHMSVSPDNGAGARMSYLRFEDQADGVHVYFDDVTDIGPLGTVATFNEKAIATLKRGQAHVVNMSIVFKPGPANDRVSVSIDGKSKASGGTWEDYYRYDPEAAGMSNLVPNVQKLLFRQSGTANPLNAGKGFLVDGVYLMSVPK
jgi:hypothetical protein